MREYNVKVNSEKTITDQLIADWVVTGFEGGCSYWCDKAEAVKRDQNGEWVLLHADDYNDWLCEDGCSPYANPEFWDNGKRGYRLYDPYDEKWCEHVLTMSSLLKALNYQPAKSQHTTSNWFRKVVDRLIDEDYDAGDADTLIQIAVLGEVVYG